MADRSGFVHPAAERYSGELPPGCCEPHEVRRGGLLAYISPV
ncbi:MAG TPA: hypothetical protein VE620_14045 [Myxococcales bacterium]|nr:hypothetical protein [Myxococcales bacterium]